MSDYQTGYDAGYAAGYADGMIAGDKHAQMHAKAAQGPQALQDYMHELEVAERKAQLHLALDTHFAKPVYQGRLMHCACCGHPVGDSPVQKTEYDHVFLYCSAQCRDYHAIGA